ncbi:MAG: Crp/Fnr family transcriptional regulator [Desulfobacterales bacterium]|nr:Crp/Fnr family transcriptional regulator [Desulfobacterales bacterium]
MEQRTASLLDALQRQIFPDAPAPAGKMQNLADCFIHRSAPRNNMLVRAGEKWRKVFYIHQGLIRLYYTDTRGREFNKGFFREGEFLWPIAPSAREKESLFTIAALEDLVVSVCPFPAFRKWLDQHGAWEKFALPYAESMAEQKFKREYEFLLNPAMERFRHFLEAYPELAGRIPDYHIASYLGITPVALSRIKNTSDLNLG